VSPESPTADLKAPSRRDVLRLVSLSGAALLLRCDRGADADRPFRSDLWIAVYPDSTVEVTAMRLEMGQGIRTTLAVLAGEELGVEPSRIRVRLPLSSEMPDEAQILNTGGSMSTTTLWEPIRLAAAAAREMLVAADAIHLETKSRSTRENALYSAPLLETLPGRKVLLTSDFHVFRARRSFARAGIDVSVQPVPDVLKRSNRWLSRWSCFVELAEETVKIGYYWARGWI